jgi:hypothetical protein
MSHPVRDLLPADGPHPGLADGLDLYGRLVGSWDIDAAWYQDGREVRTGRGEWHFGWILGGRAIQDVLFAVGAPPEDYGTTLRVPDPGTGAWHIIWTQPCSGEFAHLTGHGTADGIVQQSVAADRGRRVRWSFRDITDDGFLWLGEVSLDEGATWQLEQTLKGTRRS